MRHASARNLTRDVPIPNRDRPLELQRDGATISPLNCIQELVKRDRHYPWRVAVVCTLLNQTHGRGVRPMVDRFFELCDTPRTVVDADETLRTEVKSLLRPLGFQNKRWFTIWKMSSDYVDGLPIERCFGVGQYARDAIALFCDGRTDVNPSDTWLKPYLKWRLEGGPAVQWSQL